MGGSVNMPHCFNGTNLHTHGLWINPSGNSDNVLISVNPGVDFQYEYNIPPDHPAGTFWYHSHRHGSTALQVSSGMVGALIVRGTRPPTATANGDLDTLLKPISGQPFPERVMVFQQIQYACRDDNDNIETQSPTSTYACRPDEVGGVEDYDQFGPGTWPASGRFTSINGAVLGHLARRRGRQDRAVAHDPWRRARHHHAAVPQACRHGGAAPASCGRGRRRPMSTPTAPARRCPIISSRPTG